MSMRPLRLLFVFLACLFVLTPRLATAAPWWKPVDPAELALKDNPSQPGALAMILYRNVDHNDLVGSETVYQRVKIFKEEGRRYGDVQVPFFKERYDAIEDVHGRTIHPDGSVVEFSGQVLERVFERRRGEKYQVKTFALPDVTPGSVIEYQYTLRWQVTAPGMFSYGNWFWARDSEWVVQQELFMKKGHFFFRPAASDKFAISVRTVALPANARLVHHPGDDTGTMDVEDVPAYEEEEYMPPENEVRARVNFFYDLKDMSDPDRFWREQAKGWQSNAQEFMSGRAARRQLAAITSPSDNAEAKLHKIYDYVQSLNNLSYGATREVKEPNKSIEDVINHKYGHRTELNRLFVALAREAGIDATLVRVPGRDSLLFHKDWPSIHVLNLEFVLVHNAGGDLYLNPGTYACPFGTILWEETAAYGLKMDKNPPAFIQIPVPDPSASQFKTASQMVLDSDGTLAGDVELTLTGQAALDQRIPATMKDAKGRSNMMVDLLKGWISTGADVELIKVNSWEASTPLVATFKVSIPNFATTTGHRAIFRNTLMAGAYKNPFVPARRIYPIRMEFPFERVDDLTITLPKGVDVESLPKPVTGKNGLGELTTQYVNENGALHLTREFRLVGMFMDTEYYPAVRTYFQTLQTNANEPIVLKLAAAQ